MSSNAWQHFNTITTADNEKSIVNTIFGSNNNTIAAMAIPTVYTISVEVKTTVIFVITYCSLVTVRIKSVRSHPLLTSALTMPAEKIRNVKKERNASEDMISFESFVTMPFCTKTTDGINPTAIIAMLKMIIPIVQNRLNSALKRMENFLTTYFLSCQDFFGRAVPDVRDRHSSLENRPQRFRC